MNNFLFLSCVAISLVSFNACSKTENTQIEQAIVENPASPQKNVTGLTGRQTQKQTQEHTQKPSVKINTGYIQVPVKAPKLRLQTPPKPQPQTPIFEAVQRVPAFQPKSRTSSSTIRRCINLGNALEAPKEGDWGYTIRAKDIAVIKAAGFDTVRLPVRWDTHTAHRSPYQIDARFMARIHQIVANARANGLGIIIDVHHYENLMNNTAREEARFLAIWDQIARSFSKQPSSVYFEILNEPTLDMSMERLNALYAKVIPIIRASNPKRKLIIGGNSWNSVESLGAVHWPNDQNIIATFHDYGPHEFTHQGAQWSDPVMPMGRKWGGRADQRELNATYNIASAFVKKTHMPVLVGEFGVIGKVPLAQRNQWMKARRKTMEARGYGWCVWDYTGAFSIYDISKESWKPGVLNALMGR